MTQMRKLILALFVTVITSSLWIPTPAVRAQGKGNEQVQVFVLLTNDDTQQLAQVQTFISANSGRVFHTLPHQAVIAKVSPGTIQALASLPGVADVFTQAIELSAVDRYGPDARRFAKVWNSLLASRATTLDVGLMAEGHLDEQGDAFVAPDLPPAGGVSIATSASVTPTRYQTSEYMAGSVAVGIVLVESDGSVDTSTEDWTAAEKQQVFEEIVAALNWWGELEPRANLSFVYDDHFSNPLPTGVEPISRSYKAQQYWIADAMSALGYDSPSYFTSVRDYDNDLRDIYDTDWAFTIFVVDSSNDSDNRFSDSYFAYAYLGGPFMVVASGSNGYGPGNMDAVVAHEMGHIFHALDQYRSAQQLCTRRSGYLDVENQNSQYGDCASDASSIMRGQTYPFTNGAIDPYAAGQIGWRDSDGDDILDPLDTDLLVGIDAVSLSGSSVTVSGTAEIIPYPSPNRESVTINTLTGVQYRFDGGDWQTALADGGVFDGTATGYHFTVSLAPGRHTLEVAALDSAGNVSDIYASETIAILDPVDGGLNTEFHLSDGDVSVSEIATMRGMAYHLEGGIIAGVQYRLNGDSWQSINAQDGAFDSDYEPFALALGLLEAGTYLIEARAIDADGNVEVNFASQEVTITASQTYTVFLPTVVYEL